MRYKDLKNPIENMTEEQQNMDVTILLVEETLAGGVDKEFYPADGLGFNNEESIEASDVSDVLDEDHPFILLTK